jgi:restriction system protein
MSRRQRKDPLEKRVGELVGFVGLIVVGCFFVPGVRAVFSGILVLLLIGIGLMILVGWAVYRHYRKQETVDTAAYLGAPSESDVREYPALRAVRMAAANTEAEIKGVSRPTASADHGLWRDRLAGDVSKGFLKSHPETLSKELLDALEWRRFEQLVTWYFEKSGFKAKRSRVGADGGVDILVSSPGENQPSAYVQCKAWRSYKVGIKPVRELLGVMSADGIRSGYFVTSGEFTFEALEFARGKALTLMTGNNLVQKIAALSDSDRADLLREVTAGDYTTPTCPRCDIKMVLRSGPIGQFWGCSNYSFRPSCRQTFKMRE